MMMFMMMAIMTMAIMIAIIVIVIVAVTIAMAMATLPSVGHAAAARESGRRGGRIGRAGRRQGLRLPPALARIERNNSVGRARLLRRDESSLVRHAGDHARDLGDLDQVLPGFLDNAVHGPPGARGISAYPDSGQYSRMIDFQR